jgi:hypothetical protein
VIVANVDVELSNCDVDEAKRENCDPRNHSGVDVP